MECRCSSWTAVWGLRRHSTGAAIIAGVQTDAPFHTASDTVLHQMPVVGGGFVTGVFGLGDDPQAAMGYAGATFMNQPGSSGWPRPA